MYTCYTEFTYAYVNFSLLLLHVYITLCFHYFAMVVFDYYSTGYKHGRQMILYTPHLQLVAILQMCRDLLSTIQRELCLR